MNFNAITVYLILAIFLSINLFAQDVVINEVMSNNTMTLADEDSEYSDWIEIYNNQSTTLYLQNFGLSDDPDNPFRWIFPDISLAPAEYLLIYASGKNKPGLVIQLETVIDWGDDCKYFPGYSEPPVDWKSTAFDDSGWQNGPSGFGYGDDDDSTYVGPPDPFTPGPVSIFVRKKIIISDTSVIKGILLHVDYDDAFVAYLNGNEITRANIGYIGTPPAYNEFAGSSHEANLYRGLPLDGIRIDRQFIQPGDNVLALQVHNEQLYSSDLTLIPFLTFEMSAIPSNPRGPAPILQLQVPNLHANFQVRSTGENLFLTNSSGNLIDSVNSGYQPPDISRGRQPDGSDNWYMFSQSTPGSSNVTPGYQYFAEPPQFSEPAGFYNNAVNISLTTSTPQAVIYYSLDGVTPSDTCLLYSGPILIDSTRVLAACTFAPGYLPSQTITQTYFINEQYSLPVISLCTDPANFFDWETGIYVMGPNASPDYPHFGANFWQDWEKPLHLEFFEPDGTPGFSLDAGVQIFGSWSRLYPQKSLAIYARDRYGYPEINYQIFPSKPISEFQAIVLRNSGQDWGKTFFRDAMMHTLISETDVDIQAYRPAMVFINGKIWGIHNIREKMNEHYLASNHGVDPDNIDFVERDSILHGDLVHYHSLLHFVDTEDLTIPANYSYVTTQMDVDNFMDYILSVLYFANPDWPWNNVRCWRPRVPGGRWKWMLYDMDYAFHAGHLGADANTFNEMRSQQNGTTLLFFNLLENQTFRQDFINRYADHLNTTFDSTRVLQIIEQMENGIAAAMPYHIARWQSSFVGPWWLGKSIDSMEEWYSNIAVATEFARLRGDFVRQHIVDEFQLYDGGVGTLNVNVSPASTGLIQLNHLILENFPWKGKYFPSVPVKLTAIPKPGYRFQGWSGVSAPNVPAISILFTDNQTITALFEPDTQQTSPVVINEINYNSIATFETEDWLEFYNSTQSVLDISGWQFKDSEDIHVFTFPAGTILPADGYIVLCRDTSAFIPFFPAVTNYLGNMDFGLTSDGELVRLYNSQGALIDSLTFGVTAPWPTQPNGNGPTLALKNPFLDNSLPESWAASSNHGTPGELNDVYIKIDPDNEESIQKFNLEQNYPNPFNSFTRISFTLPERGKVKLEVYDVLGRLIRTLADDDINAGKIVIDWDGNDHQGRAVSSGIYFYRLQSDHYISIRKMVLIR